MKINNIKVIKKVTIGASGSKVYELEGDKIAKVSIKNEINNDELWKQCQNEYSFYSIYSSKDFDFIPKVLYKNKNENEIIIIFKKYKNIDHNRIDESLIKNMIKILTFIHQFKHNDVLNNSKKVWLDKYSLNNYYNGWKSVLDEHPKHFSEDKLIEIKENINHINDILTSKRNDFIHGDFHFNNLLQDKNDNLIICDWANYCVGDGASDLSFFISRLNADGYKVDNTMIINHYCEYMNKEDVTPISIEIQMRLANLNTSFMFWHNYLHNNAIERVKSIYEKMVDDFNFLMNQI